MSALLLQGECAMITIMSTAVIELPQALDPGNNDTAYVVPKLETLR